MWNPYGVGNTSCRRPSPSLFFTHPTPYKSFPLSIQNPQPYRRNPPYRRFQFFFRLICVNQCDLRLPNPLFICFFLIRVTREIRGYNSSISHSCQLLPIRAKYIFSSFSTSVGLSVCPSFQISLFPFVQIRAHSWQKNLFSPPLPS